MSKLRPECKTSHKTPTFTTRQAALEAIYKSVAKRRTLAFGVLYENKTGKHCAMGCYWEDRPGTIIKTDIVDEVASVNDSVPPSVSPKERWKHVMRWLRHQLGRY